MQSLVSSKSATRRILERILIADPDVNFFSFTLRYVLEKYHKQGSDSRARTFFLCLLNIPVKGRYGVCREADDLWTGEAINSGIITYKNCFFVVN